MCFQLFSSLCKWAATLTLIGAIASVSGDVVLRSVGSLQPRREGIGTGDGNAFIASRLDSHRYTAFIGRGVRRGAHRHKIDTRCLYAGKTRLPDFNECESVGDVLNLALKHKHQLQYKQVPVVWTFLSRTMMKSRPHQKKTNNQDIYKVKRNQYEQQLLDIIHITLEQRRKMSPREVTTITLAMAKIVKRIRNSPQKKRNAAQQAFSNILFDDNSKLNDSIFYELASHSNRILPQFEPRYLSNLAYAHALLEDDPAFDDGTKLLTNIANESIDRINEFNEQDTSNIVWAYATMKIPNRALFEAVGGLVSNMPGLKKFKPQELSNIVWAFSTANVHHPGLFRKIGDDIASMKDLKSFQPQDLSNIVWSYATANVQHPSLFKKVGDDIVTVKDLRK